MFKFLNLNSEFHSKQLLFVMAAGTATSTLLPPVKRVVVYKNGDPFYCGRRFVVNQRQVSTMEAFLTEVTQSIGASLAVRNLYTPRQGHRVTDLQELRTGAQYVAAGFERFKKLDLFTSGALYVVADPPPKKLHSVPLICHNCITSSYSFSVFRNGDLLCPPFRFIIPRNMQQDLEQILSLVTDKVSLRTGAVRRLCSLEGVPLSSASELKTGHSYVAVGTERFKKLPYEELLVSKAAERYCYASSYVCSVVFTAEGLMADRRRFMITTTQHSVFKRAGRKRREEVRGAEEVAEDENTATEIPIDQVSEL
uniref:Doublecortin domain-containing protein n=1 Tax=Periophthalmus magnuspinnatus TaxID=409849 RepID=A0A3B4A926_9GOBI